MDTLSRSWGRPCRTCGQHHARHEPHVYDYVDDVDEDLTCHICLQPLVGSLDTPCGHTFCGACLVPYLNSHQNCPICRAALTTQACRNSPLVLQKILEKLLVKCPNADLCKETAYPRGDLEDHLKNRCQGNFIACRYATHGCQVRGPQKAVHKHQADCEYRNNGDRPCLVPDLLSCPVERPPLACGVEDDTFSGSLPCQSFGHKHVAPMSGARAFNISLKRVGRAQAGVR